jgi:DNA-binding GntR family transcriptional regulator
MTAALASVGGLERVTLGGRVHAELRERLISGELAPGDKLSLRSVAEELGTSMMPVREAVTRLVAEDALEVLPNRAVRVPVMTLAKFRELTAVRIAIEGFAAERAALERSEADLVTLKACEAAFRREAGRAKPDGARAVRANAALHFAAYRAAGLLTLVSIIEGLWLKIGPVLNLDIKVSTERLTTGGAVLHHARLVAGIAERDPAAAAAGLVADIRGAAAFIEATGRLG